MDDSFRVYRKQRRPIISSDESEDDEDFLDTSQPDQTCLGTTLRIPHHIPAKPQDDVEVDIHEESQDSGRSFERDSSLSASDVHPAIEFSRDEIAESDDSLIETSSSDTEDSALSDEDIKISDSEAQADAEPSPAGQDAVDFAKSVPIKVGIDTHS